MLNPEDFEIPLEKQLKMRVVHDEIDECKNVEALQENLKQCAEQLMKYQHILTRVLHAQLVKELGEWEESLK
tara:strand:+ start:134 stop:349 length:216 start_codon:yes stop_codon:yes gene_type:complete